MKREKQNNPIVVGALLCILVGSVTKTLLDLRSQGASAGVVTPIASTQAVPVNLSPSSYRPPRRDPFFHTSLPRTSLQTDSGVPDETPFGWSGIGGPNALATLGIQPLAGAAQQTGLEARTSPSGKAQTAASPGNVPDEKQVAADEQERRLVQGLKLTAILGGQRPQAVLESPLFGVKTLGLGDAIETLRLTAIHPQEVVLEGEQGIWTLPLGSEAEEKNLSSFAAREDANGPR
jgi:hypothetical protein